MSLDFYKYYKEIKNRIILVFLAWIFSFSICYFYRNALLFTLINSNSLIMNINTKPYFIFTNITEIFNVYLELTFFITNQLSILFLIYHICIFLSLGLYKFELIRLKLALKVFVFSWSFSMILLFNLVIPFSWDFFIGFQTSSNAVQPFSIFFETRLIEYLHYFTNIYFINLMSCQLLSVVTIALININKTLSETKRFRKLFYLVFVLFSTIITPPDVISQVTISICLSVCYESLLLLTLIKANKVTN